MATTHDGREERKASTGQNDDVETGLKYFDGTPAAEDDLVIPGACDNASAFVFMCFTIVFPVICIAALAPADVATDSDVGFGVWHVVALACFVLGLATCCMFTRQLWCGGVFCIPRGPPPHPPLVKAFEGERTHAKVPVKKVYVIVNPHSGLQRSGSVLDLCKKVWAEAGVEAEVVLTERAGHAVELARTLPTAGYDGLVIVGGDGSLFEAANGMMQRPIAERLPLGLIPGGSGNSVLRDLNVVGHTREGETEAARRVANGDVCWIDVNEVTLDDKMRFYSVNEVTWGLGGAAAAAQTWRSLGPARYDICAVWGILKGPSDPLRIVVDGTKELPGPVATCYCNATQYFGKGLRAAPEASIDDGLLNLYVVPPQSRAGIFQIFQQMPSGAHMNSKLLQRHEAQRVELFPGAPGTINIDGENFPFAKKIQVRCLHKRLRFFVPPGINASTAATGHATAATALLA